jgi:polysaccharide biosynthesis protein PslG
MPAVRRARASCCALATLVAVLALGLAAASPASALPQYRGVQLHSLWNSTWSGDTTRDLDLAKQAGSNVVRLDVGWQSLETSNGQYAQWYVDRLDYFMSAARARGIKVVAMLHLTPCWASSAPDSVKQGCSGDWWARGVGLYPPSDPATYGNVARWVTARYGTDLAALEVWNEPNDDRYLTSSDNAADYARLVKAAYGPAKAGNPNVPVLAGAIQYSDRNFLDALYANGIKGYYDGISVHPYSPGIAPSASYPSDVSHAFRDGLNWVHQGQLAAGDSTPLWITEFGWSTCTGNGACVSESQQASYTIEALSVLQEMPWVKGAVLYNLREKGSNPYSQEDKWGITTPDWSPKPAYAALKSALTGGTLPPAPPPATGNGAGSGSDPGSATPPPPTSGTTPPPPTSGTTTPPPTSGTTTPAKGSKRRKKPVVTLRAHRRGATAYVSGAAPARSRVTLRISSCKASNRKRRVKVASNGRFTKTLGRVSGLRRCTVKAKAKNAKASRRVKI